MSDFAIPETRYARSGDLSIAYQVVGDGPIDLVFVPGFVSHVELDWESPFLGPMLRRLASFSRLVTFDKRGTGLSDRSVGLGTLEQRMDDVRAVMDAAGMERAAVYGVSEGGPMSVLFAATYPERVDRLALGGTFARMTDAPDYPQGLPLEMLEDFVRRMERRWGTGRAVQMFVQHLPEDAAAVASSARFERYTTTPSIAVELMHRNFEIDVRAVLPAVRAPSLVVHCVGDPVVPIGWGRYVAEHLPDVRYVEIPGDFHASGRREDVDALLDPVEEFLTGVANAPRAVTDRVLTTVLFTDIVGSTVRATELGDAAWRALLDRHDTAIRAELARFRGREVNTTGDGFVACFDGPARAVQCAQVLTARAAALGVEIRAGVHTGECEVRGGDLAGIAVHIGARVAARAGAGEVLVTRTVKDLVAGSGLQFEDRGEHALKGIDGEIGLLAAVG